MQAARDPLSRLSQDIGEVVVDTRVPRAERVAVGTLAQPQLWVPHISLVFGEMWEMNLLSRLDLPGVCSLGSEAQWRDCSFPATNHSNLSRPSRLVIPTGAKRNGGICSPPGKLKLSLRNCQGGLTPQKSHNLRPELA